MLKLSNAKLLYAAPTCWGFANFGDMNRLEAFLGISQSLSSVNKLMNSYLGHSNIIPPTPFVSCTIWAQHTIPHPYQST